MSTSAPPPATTGAPPSAGTTAVVPHSALEDVVGLAVGCVLTSFGLVLLHVASAVTGGTAGLGLLLSYALPVPFGVVFVAVNLPFFALAVRAKGWAFTLRSLVCVVAVSALTPLHAAALGHLHPDRAYAVVLGNLAAGIGILVLFRHRASIGGFGVVALLLQERYGLRAGYVQMALDAAVVLAALAVVPPGVVGLSFAGVVVLDLVLAMNHRPGRYLG